MLQLLYNSVFSLKYKLKLKEIIDIMSKVMEGGIFTKAIRKEIKTKAIYVLSIIALQVVILLVMLFWLNNTYKYYYPVCILLAAAATCHILTKDSNPEYKIAWLIPMLLLPIVGGLLYLFYGFDRSRKTFDKASLRILHQHTRTMDRLPTVTADDFDNKDALIQSRYIESSSGCMAYSNTKTSYLPTGRAFYNSVLEELPKAKKYIFLEYFIIEEGTMWDSILNILSEKAKQGVEVRLMFDDFGCLLKLPKHYEKQLEALGIKVKIYSPIKTIISPKFNNRDHRKICVIDGIAGFTGGINLADEYINETQPYGHWKDSAVRLEGRAVWSLAVQFLTIWNLDEKTSDSFVKYLPSLTPFDNIEPDGIVQPYTDIPMDKEPVGESVYLNLINRAHESVYITTPYLVIDSVMMAALQNAAKSGIDVKIITPHVPDKKLVFLLTRSYYKPLISSGVEIYEYTPGFIHAKTVICDKKYGVVGTINFDFRSLYLHLENAVWMYNCNAVNEMVEDFNSTLEQCREVRESELANERFNIVKQFLLTILRAFAPLI